MKHHCYLLSFLLCVALASSLPAYSAKKNTLRYGESVRPDTFDPYTSREPSSLRLTELMFNGLISINARQEIEPDLAERWEISGDKKTFTFHLRKNVYWHSKEEKKHPFTAKDVIFTKHLISHKKTDSNKKSLFEYFDNFKILDDYTIQITLKDISISSLALFQFKILPEHILGKANFLSKNNPFSNRPIGTGPYQYLRSNHNRQVTLIANPLYYAGKPKIERIIAKPFADKNIMNQALNFNALDLIVDVSPRHIGELQANQQFQLVSYNTLSYSFFAYNQKNKHLAKQKVRKALSHAINRKQMLSAFFNGQGRIISGPFPPGSWAYNLDVLPDQFNPKKSMQLLEDAGYKKTENGLTDSNGKPVVFTIRAPINKNDETAKRVILTYMNYLKKIGIKLKVDFMERKAWKKSIFFRHNYDITFASLTFDDASDISNLFHSKYQGAGQNNFIQYANPEVDRLLDLNQSTLDYETKRTINHKLHKIIAHDSPYTFLWSLNNYAAYNKKLKNVKIHPYSFFSHIEKWEIQ